MTAHRNSLSPTCWLALLALAGCGGGGGIEASKLSLPELPKLESVAAIGGREEAPVGSATEIYARVGRGAVGCWFGASGPLKQGFIYHAEADAPSRGGKAEIVVHVRDPGQPNPRGAKAYRINIDPTSETTATVKTENLRMTEPVAAAMAADIGRWSRGDQGCAGTSTTAGWQSAPEGPGDAPQAANKKSSKKKVADKKAAPR